MSTDQNRNTAVKKKFKKRYYLYIFLAILVGIRIWLPFYIKNTLVNGINDIEGYSCTIEDVDLALYRGGMTIENLNIMLTENEVTTPYVEIKEIDLSVHFKAILDGEIVGEVYIDEPIINLMDSEEEEEQQTGDASWAQPLLDFNPLRINEFVITNGTIQFENKSSTPPVDLHMTQIYVKASNLTNATDMSTPLPSAVSLTANIMESGEIKINGGMNILKEIPDMDIEANINNVNLVELNDFTNAYAKFDFEGGMLNVASEIALKDSEINGYIKPILKDVDIFSKKESASFRNKVWQASLGLITELTENQRKNQTGTKIPFKGKYTDPDIGIFTTLVGVFKNMLIKAYEAKSDDSINFSSFGDKKEGLKEKVIDVFTKDK